jgi:hypothetical protein
MFRTPIGFLAQAVLGTGKSPVPGAWPGKLGASDTVH